MKKFFLLLLILLLFPTHPVTAKKEGISARPTGWAKKYGKLQVTSEELLTKALKKDGPLNDWLALKLATLYLAEDNNHESLNLLEKIPADGPWEFWRTVLLAQTYLGLKQSRRVTKLLESLPPEPDITINKTQTFFRQLYRQAMMIKDKARWKTSKSNRHLRRRIWALFPDFEEPKASGEAPGLRIEDKATRLHVLHEKKLYETVPELLDVANIVHSKLSREEKCQALFEWGNSLRALKEHEKALSAFTAMIPLSCDETPLTRGLYRKAQIEKKLKKFDEAIKTYQYFVKIFPNHRYTDDAYYSLWNLYRKNKQQGKSNKAWKSLISLRQGDMKDKALWKAAYKFYKNKDFKKATAHLDKILNSKSLGDEAHPQARYWEARIVEVQSKESEKNKISAEAKDLYQRLIEEYPFSFYSVLASHRLGIDHKAPSIRSLPKELPEDPTTQEALATSSLLVNMGLQKEAQEVLDYFSQLHSEKVETVQPLMARLWMEGGDYNKSISIATEHFGGSPFRVVLNKDDPMVRALYPLAYSTQVHKGSMNNQLAAGIIQGIMREESLFLPAVRSRAGAVGVMQLMPSTARIEAKKIAHPSPSIDDLTRPHTNVLIGSSFFKRMINMFDENIPLAIMAYNAGPGNVKKWLRRNGHLPLDEFIEEIPFSETRGYVKRVIRSAQTYGHLHKDPELNKPFFSMSPPVHGK